jgi:chitodextrinase
MVELSDDIMKQIRQTLTHILILQLLLSFIVCGLVLFPAQAADSTTISVSPASLTVSPEESFYQEILCVPYQPIKSFELKLSFDPTLLQINSISDGDIFDGYQIFSNSGTIDNTAGTVVDLYSLIVGPGNVSTSGTLVNISFTALESDGTSAIDIYDEGITDEAGYLSVSVTDGTVTIQGPDDPPDPPSGGGSSGGGSSGGGGGGGYLPPSGNGGTENQPPQTPVKPSGPTIIEMGVEYTYSSSTFDSDDDQIRFLFDWGDGTLSTWSEYLLSNTTVTMTHSWAAISTYEIKVMAQDENGSNSSWSTSLDVTVSQVETEGEPPTAEINYSVNETDEYTIYLDGSKSVDLDGAIIAYDWDFGDGTTGEGRYVTHTYTSKGIYNVTLVVTDNSGNTYSKTIPVTVGSHLDEISQEETSDFPLLFILLPIVGIGFICVFYYFKDRISNHFRRNQIHYFSEHKITSSMHEIEQLEAEIKAIKEQMKTEDKEDT